MPVERASARESLQLKRELYKAERRGLDAHECELAANEAMDLRRGVAWCFHQLYAEGTSDRELARKRAGDRGGPVFDPSDDERSSDIRELLGVAEWGYGAVSEDYDYA
jgi:hypothetical protein